MEGCRLWVPVVEGSNPSGPIFIKKKNKKGRVTIAIVLRGRSLARLWRPAPEKEEGEETGRSGVQIPSPPSKTHLIITLLQRSE